MSMQAMAQSLSAGWFERLGLPQRFALERQVIDEAWRQVQAQVHPDRHAAGSDQDRRLALQLATAVNEAWQGLRDPARRAVYLCEQHGQPVLAESGGQVPMAFLTQQMMWREELEDARQARSLSALEALAGQLRRVHRDQLARITTLIDVEQNWAEAAMATRELMFIARLQQEVTDAQAGLEDG